MALNESLAQGLSAMQGRGVDPSMLYGVPPAGMAPAAPMPVAAPAPGAAPPMPMPAAPGPSPASFYGVQGGVGPAPGAPMPDVNSGSATSAPPYMPAPPGGGVGQNGFGIHPSVDLHAITDYLLPQFRGVESSNNYKADRALTHPGQTASGAYQYIDSTWNGYGGFKRAVDAPPEVQDQRMREDVMSNLAKHGNDPFKTVASHYFPKYADNPSLWNQPLVDGHGRPIPNSQTVAQYVSSVLPKDRVASYLAANSQQPGAM